MKMKLFLVAIATFFIAGCGLQSKISSWSIIEIRKTLEDGRTVTCLIFDSGNSGGITCDWDNAKPIKYQL